MTLCTKRMLTFVYGFAAFAIGLWRHFETGDSIQAMWFGVAVGLLAVAGSFVMRYRGWQKWLGFALMAVSLGFEAGWFLRRVFTHDEGASIRVLVALAFCAFMLVVLVWPLRPSAKCGSTEVTK